MRMESTRKQISGRVLFARLVDFRYIVTSLLFAAVVSAVYRDVVLAGLLAPLSEATARGTYALIRAVGMDAALQGSIIAHPAGFRYEIYYRCTGILPVAAFVTLVLMRRGPLLPKLVRLATGAPSLLLLNLVRLVSLYWIGVHLPEWFALAHGVVWEGVMIGVVVWLGSVVPSGLRGIVWNNVWTVRGRPLSPDGSGPDHPHRFPEELP
jgi:exosortase/archaeosortase family protein